MTTFLYYSLKILIVLVFAFFLLIYLFQAKLIFFPVKLEKDFAFRHSVPFEEKIISYNDKETLHGLLFKVAQPKARILYFHGNGGALDTWGEVGAELSQKLSSDVLVLDYPGYGKSSAAIATSEQELLLSAQAAYAEFNKVTDQNLPLVIYGRSLGSGVASYLAAKNAVQALILETPYTSLKDMAKLVLPFVPSFLLRYDLDNAKNIEALAIPVMIVHGTSDATIPYTMGQRLASLNSNAQLITIEGGGHNDLSGFKLYWSAVEAFVSKIATQK